MKCSWLYSLYLEMNLFHWRSGDNEIKFLILIPCSQLNLRQYQTYAPSVSLQRWVALLYSHPRTTASTKQGYWILDFIAGTLCFSLIDPKHTSCVTKCKTDKAVNHEFKFFIWLMQYTVEMVKVMSYISAILVITWNFVDYLSLMYHA